MVVSEIFSVLSQKLRRELHCEGLIRSFHFHWTSLVLLSSCLLISSKDWIGTNSVIDCIPPSSKVPASVVNNHCYSNGGIYVTKNGKDDFLDYYQWVPVMLFLQALMFYMPHLLFNFFENGKIFWIASGCDGWLLHSDENKFNIMAKYIIEKHGQFKYWCLKLIFVFVFYFLQVVFQIVATDYFLGNQFSTYGFKSIQFLFSKVYTTHCLKITQNVAFEFWHFPPIFVLLKVACMVW